VFVTLKRILLFFYLLFPTYGYAQDIILDPYDMTSYRGHNGTTYLVSVNLKQAPTGTVWGTNRYTDHSHVSAAFRHRYGYPYGYRYVAGVTIRPDAGNYVGSSSNGITSLTFGAYLGSYEFSGDIWYASAITLDDMGGTGGSSYVIARMKEHLPTITVPTRTGYEFDGYWTASTGGIQYYRQNGKGVKKWDKNDPDVVLYGQWIPNEYTVTFNHQGGMGGTNSARVTYGQTMPTISIPSKTNVLFNGYWDAPTGGVRYYNNDGTSAKNWDKANNTILYAQWLLIYYSITYELNGGSVDPLNPETNRSDDTPFTLHNPTRTGYIFSGWTGTGLTALTMKVTIPAGSIGNRTYTAHWTSVVPTHMSILTQPSTPILNDQVMSIHPLIQLLDAQGNPVSQAGIAITVDLAAEEFLKTGKLSGTTTVLTDDQGRANFADLKVTGEIGPRMLVFSGSGLIPISSNVIHLVAGMACRLIVSRQPSSLVMEDIVFAEQPWIQVADVSGNPVASAGREIDVALSSGPEGGQLLGIIKALTDIQGQAVFRELHIKGPTGEYQLIFTTPELTDAISLPITVQVGKPSILDLVQQPSAVARHSIVFLEQPIIQLRDSGGNPVTAPEIEVRVALASGGSALRGTLSVKTDENGRAVFKDLLIYGVVGDRTLSFMAEGFASVTSSVVADASAFNVMALPW